MKAKMAEQTADFIALLVAFVARLRSQYGVNNKIPSPKEAMWFRSDENYEVKSRKDILVS